MYLVLFEKSHSQRYDDPEEMGIAIAQWLDLHPRRKVRVFLYV